MKKSKVKSNSKSKSLDQKCFELYNKELESLDKRLKKTVLNTENFQIFEYIQTLVI